MSNGIDRRSDVGTKATIAILTGIVMFGFSCFISAAWSTANEGKNKAFEIGERMIAMESRFSAFQSDLSEIKDILRRKAP